jgi:hypothetical protein
MLPSPEDGIRLKITVFLGCDAMYSGIGIKVSDGRAAPIFRVEECDVM